MNQNKNRLCVLSLNPAIDKTIYVDHFYLNQVHVSHAMCKSPGAKGINVGRMLSKIGLNVACFGIMGGEGGQYIKEELECDGVVCDFVEVDYNVRVNLKIVDLQSHTYTDINFPGQGPKAESLDALKEKAKLLLQDCYLLVLGGSLPPGVDDSIYYELAMMATEAGTKVSLDCCGEPLRKALPSKPFIIKPNLTELETTLGIKCTTIGSVIDASLQLHQDGVTNVLVSLGAKGAVAVCEGQVFRVTVPVANVVGTVGAGDSFLSGFIYGWHQGFSKADCLRYASSFAQVRVSKRLDVPYTYEELVSYVEQIHIQENHEINRDERL